MKRFKILLIACICFLATRANAQKNLVSNGGFEDDVDEWVNYGGGITPYDFKSGKNSCYIIASNTEKWVGLHQQIKIPKKAQAFEFSAWLKTINVVKGLDDWSGAVFNIEFLDKQDKKIGESVAVAHLTGDQDWTFTKQVVNVPANAVSFKLLFALGYASGAFFIDDVSAKVIDPAIAKN